MISHFESAWLKKFHKAITDIANETIAEQIISLRSVSVAIPSSPLEIINWTANAMEKLVSLVTEKDIKEIMISTACRYPNDALKILHDAYIKTQDIRVPHLMLQTQFDHLLSAVLNLTEDEIELVHNLDMGPAGVLEKNILTVTKIPKSENLHQYLHETDIQKRKQLYCHCPRIREFYNTQTTISPLYCYCGAGFYQHLWESILEQPVQIDVQKSILNNDDVCRFKITLPIEIK